MIAYASSKPKVFDPYLNDLAVLAESGHRDGWGIAYSNEGKIKVIRRVKAAHVDPVLRSTHGEAERFIGHVRWSTNWQSINAASAHPFMVRGVILAHNGCFGGWVSTESHRRRVSDSLVFLEALVEKMKENTPEALRDALMEIMADERLVGNPGANLLIMFGGKVYAYRCGNGYSTLYIKNEPGLSVVSSVPLDDGEWKLMDAGKFIELIP